MDAETNHRHWAERSGEFSPTYYAHLGPNKVSQHLVSVIDSYLGDGSVSILELGCSSGRHLAHLLDHGYEELSGIDLNEESFEVMADYFPELAETGSFRPGAIEDVVVDYPDNAFDVVYSVETLQHVHPDDEWVFDELARITSCLLVTVEHEGDLSDGEDTGKTPRFVHGDIPIFHRDWKRIFANCGMIQLLCAPFDRGTIRVFRQPDSKRQSIREEPQSIRPILCSQDSHGEQQT